MGGGSAIRIISPLRTEALRTPCHARGGDCTARTGRRGRGGGADDVVDLGARTCALESWDWAGGGGDFGEGARAALVLDSDHVARIPAKVGGGATPAYLSPPAARYRA